MGFSTRFLVIVLSLMIVGCISFGSPHLLTSSSSSFSSLSKGEDIGFTARLIHRSSPESPFYDPNATPLDLLRSSLRTSSTRATYFGWIKNSSISIKYPITPVDFINIDYVMRYSIGTPPVETYAVPDTGSSLIWLQCGCINCYNQSVPIFDPSKSSTYQSVLCGSQECGNTAGTYCDGSDPVCTYRLRYLDSSYTSGHIATETLTFQDSNPGRGNYPLTNMVFGCGHDNEDSSGQNVPGVVGLGNQKSSLVGQLGFRAFSYCISSNVSKDNSKIRFGLAATVSGGSTTALMTNTRGFYIFKDVDGIYVEGEKVDIPEGVLQFETDGLGGLLIDTGSTFTQLSSLAFDPLESKIKEYLPSDMQPKNDLNWDLCYDKKYISTVLLPEIEFRFKGEGKTFPLSNRNAWLDNRLGQFCLAIGRSQDTLSVIGMYQQRDVNVMIDLKQQQVSFKYDFGCTA